MAELDATFTDTGAADPAAAKPTCESCGVPYGRWWSTPNGKVLLCPTCAQMHGMGCP